MCVGAKNSEETSFLFSILFPFCVVHKIYRSKLRREWELSGILFLFKTDTRNY